MQSGLTNMRLSIEDTFGLVIVVETGGMNERVG